MCSSPHPLGRDVLLGNSGVRVGGLLSLTVEVHRCLESSGSRHVGPTPPPVFGEL